MKRNLALIAVLMLSLLVAGNAFAGAPVDRATGGGQTLLLSDPQDPESTVGGAGNTIAFNARRLDNTTTGTAADGEVQYVERSINEANGKGYGKGGVRYHGDVTCLEVVEVDGVGTAVIFGTWERSPAGSNFFEITVTDNGEGSDDDDDLIEINTMANPDDSACNNDDSDNSEPETALARGNAQVYDA